MKEVPWTRAQGTGPGCCSVPDLIALLSSIGRVGGLSRNLVVLPRRPLYEPIPTLFISIRHMFATAIRPPKPSGDIRWPTGYPISNRVTPTIGKDIARHLVLTIVICGERRAPSCHASIPGRFSNVVADPGVDPGQKGRNRRKIPIDRDTSDRRAASE